MLNIFRSRKIAGLMVAAMIVFSVPMPANALVTNMSLTNYLNSLRSAGYLGNGGAMLSLNGTGARAAANLTIAFPPETRTEIAAGWNFDFGMNCGGMDFNAEAFANLDMQQVLNWLKQLLTSMAFTYVLSMTIASTDIGSALDTARSMGQVFSQLLQNPCELGQKLGKPGALEQAWHSVGDCLNQFSFGNFGSWQQLWDNCKILPGEKDAAGNPVPGRIVDFCSNEIQINGPLKTLINQILGNAGYRKGGGTGLTIEHVKNVNWPKQFKTLYDKRKAQVKAILTKVKNGQALTAADINLLNGPGVRTYAEDINAIYVVTKTGGAGATDDLVDYLSSVITTAEIAYASAQIEEYITRCQNVNKLDEKEVADLKRLKESLHNEVQRIAKEEYQKQGTTATNLKDLYKMAREISSRAVAPDATIMVGEK